MCPLMLSKTADTLGMVQQWASEFSVQLRDFTTKYSGSQLLQKKLKDVESIVKIVEVDGNDLVKDYSDEIERMLGSKMKSVKRLAESAEDADLYHDFNASLTFEYYNSMMINTVDEDGNNVELGGDFPLEENEHFNNMPVNTLQSDIQIPTNVYNKDPNIINAIYNSEALNDVFISNFQKDPTLTWQFFGSSSGFFRIYPGIKWTPDANGVAAFDCRNRNWYIQAATSPKDIIIMVDISGSMKGLKMTIAKHTINTILDTLGENDFVNVIAYTDYVRYVEPCFRGTLVQADLDNREHFKLLVEALHVKGEAKIKNAMKESFKILSEARTNGQGSMCNQAIMLITDGAMEDFQSIFEEFNWPERRVRVFTYLIGREMTFAQNAKWIACNNKGYYTHISTLADVQENVMEYLHVLSRPMVINHNHDIIWTEAYMDTVLPKTKELFYTKAQSLLLMTSVSMPVFSKKKETLSHGILLGVVGTDVPLMEVMKLAPRYMLGPHGYAFLITNNGYILAHPDLRPLYKDGKTLKPKPNYNSVDMAEVEWEDTDETLRTAMVRGETGSYRLSVRASVDKGKRPLYLVNDYFYTNIDETPFSFGMVLTRGHGSLMFIGNVSVEEGLHDLTSPDLSIATEWTYCETDIDPSHRKYSQLQAAIRYLLGKEPDLQCDELLLQHTLFDAVVTAPMEAYWNALMLSDGVEAGVETAFLGTRSGLMRIIRYAGVETRVAKRFLTEVDKDNLFTIDHFPLWYRLAVENTPGSFYYYTVNDKGVKYVIATTAVTVSSGGRTAVAGAIGVQLSLELLEKRFWAVAKQPSDTDCSAIEGVCPLSCDSADLNCFLVDNNGFILLSKEKNEVGRFLGEVDGSVMASLVKMGLYKKVSLFDYQAMCKNSHHHASSARPLLSPFYCIAALIRWLFSNALMFLLDFNLCGLWHSDYFVDAKAGYHTSHKQKKMDAYQPCDTAYPGFMYDSSVREANSLIKCGRCQKMFVVQQIPDSNLVLVVTQADCDCSRQYGPMPLEPKEIKYNATVKCNRMKSQKVRRRPSSCHAYHPKENAKECGGASAIIPSLSVFSVSLLVSALLHHWT
ncbi:voltage-dependent calcium channel subunit alpha-2/delta-4 isoform X1 [Perca flavescens]|uniref:voltage-dependent calcium channel subunit alpha-2/delta-4 isoform X1 n=1 Tax=Perca flavescens TaxID=8167 RepID=UPI00106E8342|nr:voltage-dependent calcium channel subunit alpha-2/delta-4-like isoform X1 [Perca flavescens]XP_028440156.1 voltage-dependent calcium channel subunit alpha-2/delta-4-like isoform X1 [Perca flavescens]XP_028440157.1 voltage-dependent calcium channel subunit alpha-2/delta-4-like isoform X1 [Perca flavescens]